MESWFIVYGGFFNFPVKELEREILLGFKPEGFSLHSISQEKFTF